MTLSDRAKGWLVVCMVVTALPCEAAFVDRTATLAPGLSDGHSSWGDFNNDSYPDLYSGDTLWRNNGGTNFTALPGYGWGIWGDYDNDGYLDIFVLGGSRVMRNLSGSGNFSVLTHPALPTTDNRGACWADLDNDGYVDLYVGGYEADGYQPDAILSNNNGTGFVVSWQEPLVAPDNLVFPGRGVTACDFDRDGDQDIYVSNYRIEANYLWLNNGSGAITGIAIPYGVAGVYDGWRHSYGHTIGSAWGDFNNDGYIDLFVGNFSHWDAWQDRARFYQNDGPPAYHFTERWVLNSADWQESYASPAVADYDNDGDLDLYFSTVYEGNHARLYRNNGGWSFTDVTAAEGLGGMPSTYKAAWADFDNDGDMDLATSGRIYVNQGNANHWLKVHLTGDGVAVNRAAIGAQVRIGLGSGTLVRQVEGGTGEGNQNDLTLHFGLGSETGPVTLDVLWPNGSTHSVSNLAVDGRVDIHMAPRVSNVGVTALTHDSATLNGSLTSPSGPVGVRIYWGTADGGDTTNWQHSVWLPDVTTGSFSTGVIRLTPNTLYYFHCCTSNALGVAWADASARFATAGQLPFEDTYWGGPLGTLGSFDGKNGWRVDPELAAFASAPGGQGDGSWFCNFASSGTVWHAFSGAGRTSIIWSDLYTIPGSDTVAAVRGESVKRSAIFYVEPTTGQVVAYDGGSTALVGSVAGPSSGWTRFTTRIDYSTATWDLWMNATNIARSLGFYDPAASAFAQLKVVNSTGGKLDSVSVSGNRPLDIPFIDDDGDGLDDDWEDYHLGSTTITSGTTGEDWDHDGFDDICEFLAGTDPTDDTSLFAITSVWPAPRSAVVLTWSSVSNMHYAVLASTNLHGEWIPLVSNIAATPPVNTNRIATPSTPVFYSIQTAP